MSRLPDSHIGYIGLGADGRPIERYYGWNPFGFGCSNCHDGICGTRGVKCWASQLAKRMKCPQCRAFVPHFHAERLEQPLHTKAPGIALVGFQSDIGDEGRAMEDVFRVLEATGRADHHTYVFLTQQPEHLAWVCKEWTVTAMPNWWWGLTVHDQEDFDAKWPAFRRIPGHKWVSHEPAQGPVDWAPALADESVTGIIIGHDRNRGAKGTEDWDRLYECQGVWIRAGRMSYLKQQWAWDGRFVKADGTDPADCLPWSLPPEATR